MIRLKRLFGKISKSDHGTAVISDTLDNCRDLAWFIERYPMVIDPADYLRDRETEHIKTGERIADLLGGQYEAREFAMAMPPREYQKIAAEMILQGKSLLLADDVGLGKTCSAIAAITDPACRPALVVTLTHLPRQWADEIARFAPGMKVHILKKGTPYEIVKKTPLLGRDEFPDVIITNYHKLSGWSETLAKKVKSIVFDEGQELRRQEGKNREKTKKWAAAKYLADKAEIKMVLSATPIFNYGSEIFNVLEVLKPGALGTQEEFEREWCESGGKNGQKQITDPKAFGMYLRDQGLMLRRTRKEVGRELPPIVVIPHHIDVDAAPLEEVATAAAELCRVILASGESEKGAKLRASEEFSMRIRQATGIAKANHVADFVRVLVEQGEKVLLFGWHRAVYDLWLERLADLNPAMYTGTESPTKKAAEAERFKTGEAPILIMSLRSGAGVDGLQFSARTVVFGELDWSPAVHEQAIGRIARDGQADSTVVYYLLSGEGSDPIISNVNGVKRQQLEGIRDPNGDLLQKLSTDQNRIRKLAESYLVQRGLTAPTLEFDDEPYITVPLRPRPFVPPPRHEAPISAPPAPPESPRPRARRSNLSLFGAPTD